LDKLLFIYDDLMTGEEQAMTKIPLVFLSFGQMQGRMRFINDTKKRRYFVTPNYGRSTKVVFGGIFLLKDYEFYEHKLHSYYNNSLPYAGKTMKEDLYDFAVVKARQISMTSLKNLADGRYEVGNVIECFTFVGNQENSRIQHSMSKRYYKCRNICKIPFVKMVEENATINVKRRDEI